jgi:acyl carrier protein
MRFNMEEIIVNLAAYITREILKQPKRTIRPDEAIISSGLVDSFSLVDLGMFVEDNFGAHIDDTELNSETFDTLEQLAALIKSRQ